MAMDLSMDLDLIVKLIGSLALVIGLLLATLYIMKRQGFAVNESLQIESSVSVGPKERILMIKCGEEKILVGVTASNIRTLYVAAKTEKGFSADQLEEETPCTDKLDEDYEHVMEAKI